MLIDTGESPNEQIQYSGWRERNKPQFHALHIWITLRPALSDYLSLSRCNFSFIFPNQLNLFFFLSAG
jgi:hypothetical protein